MNAPPISIVIPCFNQGNYINEALDSLERCDKSLFETIIINDGSTDSYTNKLLQELSDQGFFVIFQENMGLAKARNNGVKSAKGKYILPLDSDNKIRPEYLTRSLEVFDKKSDVAVVYGNAAYFGDKSGLLKPGEFNLQRLMLRNYIDACAVIKKSVIEEMGYYDTMRFMGLEDWDMWLRIAFSNYGFHYIDQVLFDYRVAEKSMIKELTFDIEKRNGIEEYFLNKYAGKLSPDAIIDDTINRIKKHPFRFVRKIFLKKYFPSYYKRLIAQNKIYRSEFYD
ncbi:MAG: glycosyltransferase family 2 protein [Bacteroidetes bacterium]|nr:glycosyltransferase family 2 protein [Bacteroidota bacterium]